MTILKEYIIPKYVETLLQDLYIAVLSDLPFLLNLMDLHFIVITLSRCLCVCVSV